MDWVALDAEDTVGGVLVMWDRRVLEKVEAWVGSFLMSVRRKGLEDGLEWACSSVYGPKNGNLRGLLWDELVGVQYSWCILWFCIGDFNVIHFPSESLDCTRFSLAMFGFSEFIEEINLVDLPLVGWHFAWTKGFDTTSMSRIGRPFVTID